MPRDLPYAEAAHAMQTGVAFEQALDAKEQNRMVVNEATEKIIKHLRTGLNSALVNDAALVRLLVRKGIITQDEYVEEVRLEMNREVDRYEQSLTTRLGKPVTLG